MSYSARPELSGSRLRFDTDQKGRLTHIRVFTRRGFKRIPIEKFHLLKTFQRRLGKLLVDAKRKAVPIKKPKQKKADVRERLQALNLQSAPIDMEPPLALNKGLTERNTSRFSIKDTIQPFIEELTANYRPVAGRSAAELKAFFFKELSEFAELHTSFVKAMLNLEQQYLIAEKKGLLIESVLQEMKVFCHGVFTEYPSKGAIKRATILDYAYQLFDDSTAVVELNDRMNLEFRSVFQNQLSKLQKDRHFFALDLLQQFFIKHELPTGYAPEDLVDTDAFITQLCTDYGAISTEDVELLKSVIDDLSLEDNATESRKMLNQTVKRLFESSAAIIAVNDYVDERLMQVTIDYFDKDDGRLTSRYLAEDFCFVSKL